MSFGDLLEDEEGKEEKEEKKEVEQDLGEI